MSAFTAHLTQLRSVIACWHAEHDSVADSATTVNLKHLRWMTLVCAAINALHVAALSLQILSGAHQGVPLAWRTGLLVAHFVMGLMTIFIALAVRRLDPVQPNTWSRLLPVGAVAVCLLFALVIAVIDQLVTPNITPFIIGCLLIGVIFYIRPSQSFVLYLSATLAYWFGIGLTQTNPEQLFSNRLNGITIGILGWILQFVIWRNFTTITRQQRRLEQVNQQLTERQAELEHLARKDALTGMANRFAANERLHTEFVSMKRARQSYAVLMMDIDFFKRINDTHGHAIGDQVLQRVAKTLQSTLRESDFSARFGGEEFLALLPATELSAATKVAEKLRQAIEASPDPVAGRVTLSIGLSLAAPDQANEDVAVREADDALYRAKRDGRNRLQTAPEALERSESSANAPDKLLQLVWRAQYDSGDRTIDAQHRALFRNANKLLTAALEGHPTPELITLVDSFIAEVELHFRDEETIIEKAGYPAAAEHAALHRALLAQAAHLARCVRAESLSVPELFKFLANDVVARHMLTADREFFAYLQAPR